MGNLKDFYIADIEKLKEFRNNLMDKSVIRQGGITRQIALDSFVDLIKQDLILLGADESQL